MFFVYILYSPSINKYYCGQTNNLNVRLERHNKAEVKSTKHGVLWALIFSMNFETRSAAMKLELTIKKRGIKRWLEENAN